MGAGNSRPRHHRGHGTCFLISAGGGSDLIITHPTGAPPVPGYGRYVDGQSGSDRLCIANGVPEINGNPYNPPSSGAGDDGVVDASDSVGPSFVADSANCSESVAGCNISGSSPGVVVSPTSPYMRQPSPWVQGNNGPNLIVARGSCFLISAYDGNDHISTYPIGPPPVSGWGRYVDGLGGSDRYCIRNGVNEVVGNPYSTPVNDSDVGVIDPTDTVPAGFLTAADLSCKY